MLQPAATSAQSGLAVSVGGQPSTAENLDIPEGFAALLALGMSVEGVGKAAIPATLAEGAATVRQALKANGNAIGNLGGKILPALLPDGEAIAADAAAGLDIQPTKPAGTGDETTPAVEIVTTPTLPILAVPLPIPVISATAVQVATPEAEQPTTTAQPAAPAQLPLVATLSRLATSTAKVFEKVIASKAETPAPTANTAPDTSVAPVLTIDAPKIPPKAAATLTVEIAAQQPLPEPLIAPTPVMLAAKAAVTVETQPEAVIPAIATQPVRTPIQAPVELSIELPSTRQPVVPVTPAAGASAVTDIVVEPQPARPAQPMVIAAQLTVAQAIKPLTAPATQLKAPQVDTEATVTVATPAVPAAQPAPATPQAGVPTTVSSALATERNAAPTAEAMVRPAVAATASAADTSARTTAATAQIDADKATQPATAPATIPIPARAAAIVPADPSATDTAPTRSLAATADLAAADPTRPIATAEFQPVITMREAQPAMQTVVNAPSVAPTNSVQTGHDFATLVDRLVEARDAAAPQAVRAAVRHADFGQVSLNFQTDDNRLSVSMTSADPDFAPAVQAAAAMQANTSTDNNPAGQRQDAQSQQQQNTTSSASSQSQAQTQGQSQAQSQGSPRGERDRTETTRQSNNSNDSAQAQDEAEPGRRGGIYA